MIIIVTATASDLIADGQAALRRGDAAVARNSFQAALSLGPDSAALQGLGFAAYLAMEFDEGYRSLAGVSLREARPALVGAGVSGGIRS